ncbi:MAG: hypothetical protein AAGI23_11125 [Bacteroidota bacterium]
MKNTNTITLIWMFLLGFHLLQAQDTNPLLATKSEQWEMADQTWLPTDSSVYRYNEQERLIERVDWMYAVTEEWQFIQRWLYSDFDEADRWGVWTIQEWAADEWQNSVRYLEDHDESGNLLLRQQQQWLGDEWQNLTKNERTYDAQGNELSDADFEWIDGAWVRDEQHLYGYNEQGQIVADTFQRGNAGEWENIELITYEYDEAGTLQSSIRSSWDFYDNAWLADFQYLYSYDEGGLLEREVTQQNVDPFSYTGPVWETIRRTMYEYNEADQEILTLNQEWNNGDWENSGRIMTEYGSFGYRSLFLFQTWGEEEWVNEIESRFERDGVGNVLLIQRAIWRDGEWDYVFHLRSTYDDNGDVALREEKAWDGSEFINDRRTNFYRERAIMSSTLVAQNTLQSIQLYPNPNRGQFFLEGIDRTNGTAQLKVYTTKGDIVHRQVLLTHQSSMLVQLPDLPMGAYWVNGQRRVVSMMRQPK